MLGLPIQGISAFAKPQQKTMPVHLLKVRN
ncbi:Uncharacterised protein [Proteus vulgaris]|uniref:Uncharacterized protein n=1 Tax=Proteus vulgaris TaxID=585 RepID=A0A379FBI8_PROVU|nr:Uncharacterised protein [Proteus vulgaris]VTP74394.1 Uncharacterised protein [Proteus vulgaris]